MVISASASSQYISASFNSISLLLSFLPAVIPITFTDMFFPPGLLSDLFFLTDVTDEWLELKPVRKSVILYVKYNSYFFNKHPFQVGYHPLLSAIFQTFV